MPNKYHSVFGWTDYHDIYEEAVKKYNNAAFAEIGSFQGKSAVMMGEYIKEYKKTIQLHCIDLFPEKSQLAELTNIGAGQGEEGRIINELPDSLYNTFLNNIRRCEVDDVITINRGCSYEKALDYVDEFFSFVFIDAAHHKSGVLLDLNAWWPKIKTGGMMAGHDFDCPGVCEAVYEFFNPLKVEVHKCGSSWKVYK